MKSFLKKKMVFLLSFLIFLPDFLYAHGERTNSSGCHNSKYGYHCHGGGSSYQKNYSPSINSSPKIRTKSSFKSNQNMDTIKRVNQGSDELVIWIQMYLNKLGFDAGEEDGILGRKTKKAIRLYQKKKGIKVDGKVSFPLLYSLKKDAKALKK